MQAGDAAGAHHLTQRRAVLRNRPRTTTMSHQLVSHIPAGDGLLLSLLLGYERF